MLKADITILLKEEKDFLKNSVLQSVANDYEDIVKRFFLDSLYKFFKSLYVLISELNN